MKNFNTLKNPILACLAILIILPLGFFGCHHRSQTSFTPPVQTITLSAWGSSQETAVLKALLSEFESRHPDIRVKLMHVPDNYFQKLHLLLAGNLAPDVIMLNSINYPVYASQNLLMDLSSHASTATFYPQALAAFQWTDSGNSQMVQGALPRDISNVLVYYNKDWFKQAGLAEPDVTWTWDELVVLGKKLTVDANGDGHPERFGMSFYTKPPLFWLPFIWSAGGDVFNQRLSQANIQQPTSLAALRFYQSLRWQHHIAPRQEESGGANMSQLFLQQKVAMLISGRWSVPVFREQATFDWDVLPLPIGPSGQSKVGIDASGYGIYKKTPYPKAALALLDFLTSQKAVLKVATSGLIVPARRDVAQSAEFLSPNLKPSHSSYFVSIIEDGVATRTPQRWNEFSEELMLALQPVWDGKQSPEAVLTPTVIKRLNALLPEIPSSSLSGKPNNRHKNQTKMRVKP